eukprot:NODE_1205_length_1037_cov_234.926113_g833_i0.p1 GENE.NODE_1205_length_1037_cov_234.926113_g833_i0~~NODE_1205_length_1037_cov_234.926113_g833_i0.p1  ORF type:complete len:232 (-),score=36.88 NODE_1205_length_1037_cov_234.926113_g833_i0:45-740(-)
MARASTAGQRPTSLEWKHSPLLIGIPKARLTPEMSATLAYNSQQFTTKWDLYHTFLSLPRVVFGERVPFDIRKDIFAWNMRTYSLLEERVPETRTCQEAGLGLWVCLCAEWVALIKTAHMAPYISFVPAVIKEMNNHVDPTRCLRWRGSQMSLVKVRYSHENPAALEFDIAVQPGYIPEPKKGSITWHISLEKPANKSGRVHIHNIHRTSPFNHLKQCGSGEEMKLCVCKP